MYTYGTAVLSTMVDETTLHSLFWPNLLIRMRITMLITMRITMLIRMLKERRMVLTIHNRWMDAYVVDVYTYIVDVYT